MEKVRDCGAEILKDCGLASRAIAYQRPVAEDVKADTWAGWL